MVGLCHNCGHWHHLNEKHLDHSIREWQHRHNGHQVSFVPDDDRFFAKTRVAYKRNADIKIEYASSANLTITLASLATDANLLTGRESTAIVNTSNKYLDHMVGGLITAGTSPTADKTIEIWAYAPRNDIPDYPDVFDGTDSAETVTSTDIKLAALRRIVVLHTDSTSDRGYYFGPVSIASLYGGPLPTHWGVFVTHDTGVNFNSTAGNHEISQTGVYATSV